MIAFLAGATRYPRTQLSGPARDPADRRTADLFDGELVGTQVVKSSATRKPRGRSRIRSRPGS